MLVALLVLLIAAPSFAWNYTGHKSIGVIAYGLLTPATRLESIRFFPDIRIIRSRRQRSLAQAKDVPRFLEAAICRMKSGTIPLPHKGNSVIEARLKHLRISNELR